MPTRKQRRRHQKARRHEYEYVYLDEEGNEVPVEQSELRAERNGQRDSKPGKSGAGGRGAAGRGGGSGRKVEPPSWRRSARRALLFGPILVVAMMLLNRGQPLAQQIFPAVFLIAFFIPFSYFTDSLAYRMLQKRLARRETSKTR
ncbi:MAG: hypothetical protein E6G09_06240 [Actinobacteria bacterium]|nr:MAG: hypothetical protein E6G18_12740 [Actinomycetota bacterium]TML85150.1 MAG: hypothetical protein E6G09_06240 [Actinomycetota bacterium]